LLLLPGTGTGILRRRNNCSGCSLRRGRRCSSSGCGWLVGGGDGAHGGEEGGGWRGLLLWPASPFPGQALGKVECPLQIAVSEGKMVDFTRKKLT
jgi:hypothetical protein